MIAHDSWWSNERARFNYHRLSSTIIDYHAPFDQGLKGQYHAIFSNTLKIERRYLVDSSQDIMTKIPLKDYQNTKKLSTDIFAGR